jgi:hypothetical protein
VLSWCRGSLSASVVACVGSSAVMTNHSPAFEEGEKSSFRTFRTIVRE